MECVKCGKRVSWDTSAGLANHLYCMSCAEKVAEKYHESIVEAVHWICYEGSLREKGDITVVNDI